MTTAGLRDAAPGDEAAHILIVDDDARIRSLLGRYLGREGFRVSMAGDTPDARALMAGLRFDLAVVDVMMPGETGLDLVAWMRRTAQTAATPVLMLTARSEAADRIDGLEAGADDYLGKPFEPRELVLRIQSILRRARVSDAPLKAAAAVRFGPFRFHPGRGELHRDRHLVRLTGRECETLRLLAVAQGAAVSRHALAGPGGEPRSADVQVTRLRRRLEADPIAPAFIQTVRGVGYRLVAEPAA